ncbi:hypothetical protein IMSAGC002_03125 [Lachnospiraceae bacterium]|nr:hypothetical protein IMSAGC002_03125 [Lachnospiraceae bacterium]
MGMLLQAADGLLSLLPILFTGSAVPCSFYASPGGLIACALPIVSGRSASGFPASCSWRAVPGNRLLYIALIPMDMVSRVIFLFSTYQGIFLLIAGICMGMPFPSPCFLLSAGQFLRFRIAVIPMGMAARFLLAAHQLILGAVAGIAVAMASGPFLLAADNRAVFVIASFPMAVPAVALPMAAGQVRPCLVAGDVMGMACRLLLAASQFLHCCIAAIPMGMAASLFLLAAGQLPFRLVAGGIMGMGFLPLERAGQYLFRLIRSPCCPVFTRLAIRARTPACAYIVRFPVRSRIRGREAGFRMHVLLQAADQFPLQRKAGQRHPIPGRRHRQHACQRYCIFPLPPQETRCPFQD